jgi:hypothetical protein
MRIMGRDGEGQTSERRLPSRRRGGTLASTGRMPFEAEARGGRWDVSED